MNMTLLGYSFASGITLIILTTVYWLLLRNTTHFVLNRICVVGILTVSLIAPFVTLPQLSSIRVVPVEIGELTLSAVTSEVTGSHQGIDILKIIGSIYLIGVAIMTLRYFANFVFIIYLRSISRKKVSGRLTLRVHKRANIPPMSWGGEIFIEESLLSGDRDELEIILAHENAHHSQCHWLDLMLSNIVLAINWYNPAAWIMQNELIAVHEYEADRIASDISGDKIKYQLLLIKKTAGNRYQAIADSLNHSSLKKRIKMMMKTKTNGNARLRSLALLPAVAAALLVTNSSCVKNAQEQVDENTQTDSTSFQITGVIYTDSIPSYFIEDNDEGVIGNESELMNSPKDNSQKTAGRVSVRRPIDFSSKDNAPLVIIDGKEGSIENVKHEDIMEMSVLSDAAAKAQYGDRAANGVVIVRTKKANEAATASQYKIPAKAPEFEGGVEKLYKMLAEKIQYPEDAMKDGVQGKVIVELTVGTNGEISNAKVLRGVNESLDKEALAAIQRVKEAGGKFIPAYDAEGNPVVTTFALPISFRLQ
ncbi:MAG: M56 family metallopeptidase [Muribaculaceae bacterium]|nr:M56 family metallopeptidase [Muribaculaceae bacterium]